MPLLTAIANFSSTALITSLNNNMIKISNTLRRNTLTPALSALVAVSLLATASNVQAAKADQRILDAVTAASTQDIEAISRNARDTADLIGAVGGIKMSGKNIKTLGKGLADAIINKTENPADPNDRNRLFNKIDEIGEVAAFIQEGVANNPKYQKLGKAKKATLTILKSVMSTAKKTATFVGTHFFTDVAASVALTIHNDLGIVDTSEEKIQKFLVKKSKSIAGKTNRDAVTAGLNEGFDNDVVANVKREDGNIDALAEVDDAETDFRNGA